MPNHEVPAPLYRYHRHIDDILSLGELRSYLATLDPALTAEPIAIAEAMTDDDFKAWREGLLRERRGEENSDEWHNRFLDLLMPPGYTKLMIIASGVDWEGGDDGEQEAPPPEAV